MKIDSGTTVSIKLQDEIIEGVFIHQKDNFYFIKLPNGYNLGIKKRNIKEIKVKSKKEILIKKEKQVKQSSKLPKISILHTGGTIASKVDYKTGGVVAKFKPQEILSMFPELKKIAKINSKLIANIMSENMNFAHYNILAKEIQKEIKAGAKGIIITHGTDTLHYTSAALALILQNIKIPVLLVGAQRSSDRGSSDAAINLISAAIFIANTKSAGVMVCMNENQNDFNCLIMNSLKTRKMHTSRRDAFRPINIPPIARVNYKTKKIEIITKQKIPTKSQKFSLKLFNENIKVGILKTYPGIKAELFSNFKDYDGLILEGTGLGHIPLVKFDKHTLENEKIHQALKKLTKPIIAITSQCVYGRINTNVYSPGRTLQELGILGNQCDMTPETAYIKLAWLLSNYKKPEINELYSKNMAGEISSRTENIFLI